MSTISQFSLVKTVDFGITLPTDKGIHEPTCFSSPQSLSPSSFTKATHDGESETHLVETSRRIRFMDLMGSIICHYYRTYCYFHNQVVHAAFVQLSPNSPAMVWHGIKVIHQPSIIYIWVRHQSWKSINPIHAGYETSVEVSTDRAWRRLLSSDIGGMHTEKMLCGVSGDWLDDRDWITALTNSGISTSGIAQSSISTHHICRLSACNRYQFSLCISICMLMIIMLIKRHIIMMVT